MENMTIETTNANPRCTSGFAMPTNASAMTSAMPSSMPSAWTSVGGTDLRDRSAIATTTTKGHVALVAYIPGFHAWSPPIC